MFSIVHRIFYFPFVLESWCPCHSVHNLSIGSWRCWRCERAWLCHSNKIFRGMLAKPSSTAQSQRATTLGLVPTREKSKFPRIHFVLLMLSLWLLGFNYRNILWESLWCILCLYTTGIFKIWTQIYEVILFQTGISSQFWNVTFINTFVFKSQMKWLF